MSRAQLLSLHAVLSVAVLVSSPARAACRECSLNGKPVDLGHGSALKGKKGIVRCLDETGRVCREETIVDGKRTGPTTYFVSGVVSEIVYLKDEKRHGKRLRFGPDGKLTESSMYENDRLLIERSYFPSGKLNQIRFHLAPGQSSSGSAGFNEKGQLIELTCHEHIGWPSLREACGYGGKPGEVTLYYDNGQERARKTYVEGKPTSAVEKTPEGKVSSIRRGETDGEQSDYYKNGKLRRKEIRKGGHVVDLKEYHEDGQLVRHSEFQGRSLSRQKEYYLNGQLKEESVFASPGRKETKAYHDNGKLAEQGTYKVRGSYSWSWWVEEGESTSYYEDGTLRARASHRDGYLHGRETRYDDKGRLSSASTWEKGSLRSHTTYDAQGKVLTSEEYLADGSRKKHSK